MSTTYFEPYSPIVLHTSPRWPRMSADEFFEFCQLNPDLQIELAANGDLLIMTPSGSESSGKNLSISGELYVWNKQSGLGIAFDSAGGFLLPNGAVRSPDAAWIHRDRWEHLPRGERRKYAPIAPDFAAELRSPSDSLKVLHEKMAEYIANGVRLGWLIDPESKTVWVYQPGIEVQKLDQPESVAGDPVLPGFVLKMTDIWD